MESDMNGAFNATNLSPAHTLRARVCECETASIHLFESESERERRGEGNLSIL